MLFERHSFGIAGFICFGDLFDYLAGVSNRYDVCRNVFCDNTSSSNDRVIANGDSRKNLYISTQPHIFPDVYRLAITAAVDSFVGVCCMIGSIKS